jgi:RNA polymerase sigma-70 factor (ECF subfamily)
LSASDEDIPRRIRRGDRDAFDRFFARYGSALLGYLAGMVGERTQAEDLLQETVLRVYRHIDRYDERGSFHAWVFRIATNLAITELRRRRNAPTQTLDDRILALPERNVAEVGARLEAEERERLVNAGLAQLPTEQRAVFLLRTKEGMDVHEIARTLCVPPGTVKSRMHHAVRKLREFIDRSEGTNEEERQRDVQ